jgi:N-acetylglucosamine malate deacetylase 1
MKLHALAIAAHPDDIELGVAGTLIKLSRMGYKVGIIDCTQGELGTRGSPEIRMQEAQEAGQVMGLQVRDNLKLPDTLISNNRENQLKLIRLIRLYQPDLVLAQHWDTRHPDHCNASNLVTDSCHFAGLAKIETDQHRWRPHQIIYFHLPVYINPTFIVDITELYEERVKAIEAYKSQFTLDSRPQDLTTGMTQPVFLKMIEARARFYGSLIGVEFGEAFFIKNHMEIKDPAAFFTPVSK